MPEYQVPIYKLFGEANGWPDAEPIHHETIAARSALYHWEIDLHRHDGLMQVLFIEDGNAEMALETLRAPLLSPCVIWMPAGQVHGFRFSQDVLGHIVSLPHFLLGEVLARAPELRAGLDCALYLPLRDEPVHTLLRDSFSLIAEEYARRASGHTALIMAALTQIVCVLGRRAAGQGGTPVERQRARLQAFRHLVDQHFRDWQALGFYAARLGVSRAQLNNTCRAETGKSAQAVVHERMLLEARRLLAYSELDMTSIALSLGFKDSAYFTRFFARLQGMPPSAFRKACAAALRQSGA